MAAPPLKTPRTCSQCGNNGHNARTCTTEQSSGGPTTGFMLFGVRLNPVDGGLASPCSTSPVAGVSPFRKSMSMGNLSQYEHQQQQPLDDSPGGNGVDVGASGYASDDAVHASSGGRARDRKRGVPWTEEEHKLFLWGLKKVGKGDWRGIARNYVKTRTPTQVASHAQKYFLRRTNVNRRRRRSSLFDVTTDSVTNITVEDQPFNQDSVSQPKPLPSTNQNVNVSTSTTFPKPFTTTSSSSIMLPTSSTTTTKQTTCPIPLIPVPPSSKMAKLNLNQSPSPTSSSTSTECSCDKQSEPFLSLKLSSTAPSDEEAVSRASAFGGFNSNGDSIISVA